MCEIKLRKTDPGAHPASYPMGTGGFFWSVSWRKKQKEGNRFFCYIKIRELWWYQAHIA